MQQPHSQTPKNPETAFHKRQFRDFHNLDQLLANRSKMTLSIWIFSGTITLYSQNILSNSYINNNKKLVIDQIGAITSFLLPATLQLAQLIYSGLIKFALTSP